MTKNGCGAIKSSQQIIFCVNPYYETTSCFSKIPKENQFQFISKQESDFQGG